jgi:hypothetical protein
MIQGSYIPDEISSRTFQEYNVFKSVFHDFPGVFQRGVVSGLGGLEPNVAVYCGFH